MPIAMIVPDTIPFCVPTINIKPYLEDPTSTQAKVISNEVRGACVSTGFFQITGHGVSPTLQTSIFDAAAAFFALPYEEKKKLDARTTVGHRGYDVLASQSFEADALPDLKEGFYVGENISLTDARVQEKRFLMGPNVWPPSDLLAASAFKEPVEAYYKAIYDLSLVVLDIIAHTLSDHPHIFENLRSNNPVATLRLLRYPPTQKTEKRQLGASAHTDWGAIALLLQDANKGLEVLDANRDEWMPVEPRADSYVVNIGDVLSKWTNGAYKSSVHRVVNKNPWDRYSVVFFFDGNLDCPLAPLDESGAEGEKILTVEEHMIERMTSTYKMGNKGG